MSLSDFAKDVWIGMSKGVQRGRKFRIQGGDVAQQALNRMNINKIKSSQKNIRKIHLNGPINGPIQKNTVQQVGNFFGEGIRDTIKYKKTGDKLTTSIKKAHSTNGKIDATKIAGTYVSTSSIARVASGGGITKDRNGNSNIIGIPFI